MNREPTFSVIIPVYNGALSVGRAIDSVLAQTRSANEIIAVDDGSTDGTPSEIERFGNQVRYLRQENKGVSAARNAGVAAATSEWVAFLDADDYYYPDRLRLHAEWVAEDPGLDFLTGDFEYRRPDGGLMGRSLEATAAGARLLARADRSARAVMGPVDIGPFVEQHFGDTHTLSVRRDTFLALGGYPTNFQVCEDVHFLIRLSARSRRVGVVCRPLAAYVVHANSATRSDPLRAQRQTVSAFEALRPELRNAPTGIRKGLEGAIRRARRDYAYALLRHGRRLEAVQRVLPLLWTLPGPRSVRDVLSVIKG